MQEKLKPEDAAVMASKIRWWLRNSGQFEGYKKTLVKTNSIKFPYAIVHQCDLFGQSSESYENLDDAVYDFVELMKVYG